MSGGPVMKLSDYVIERIACHGVRHIFLLPGGGSMHLVDSVGKSTRLSYSAIFTSRPARWLRKRMVSIQTNWAYV